MSLNVDKKPDPEENRITPGTSPYLNKLTPEQSLAFFKNITLRNAVANKKEKDLYIDLINGKLSAFKDNPKEVNQLLITEIKLIKDEIHLAGLKGNSTDKLDDKIKILVGFEDYYNKLFKKSEKENILPDTESEPSLEMDLQADEIDLQLPDNPAEIYEQISKDELIKETEKENTLPDTESEPSLKMDLQTDKVDLQLPDNFAQTKSKDELFNESGKENILPDTESDPSLELDLQIDELNYPLPDNFSQITYSRTIIPKEELIEDFMALAREKNPVNNEPFIAEEDVVPLLEKNYNIFGCRPNGKYFQLNFAEGQKYILPNFIFKIYQKYEIQLRGNKEKYARFLKHNFELYKDDDLDSLRDNIRHQAGTKFQLELPNRKK